MTLPAFTLSTWALMIASLTILISMWLWQRKGDNNFDLTDLCRGSDGKLGVKETGHFIAILTSTWGFVSLILADRMTEWYFGGYMFILTGANIAKQLRQPPKEKP